MTFGRPCSIPESYIKLDAPSTDIHMLKSGDETASSPRLDGAFYYAAMWV